MGLLSAGSFPSRRIEGLHIGHNRPNHILECYEVAKVNFIKDINYVFMHIFRNKDHTNIASITILPNIL